MKGAAARPIRRVRGLALCGALLGLVAGALTPARPAGAFVLDAVEAERDGATFRLRIDARFDATPAQLMAVLTDYDRLHELHPRVTASRSLGVVGAGTEEVYSSFTGCVLIFCRSMHRVERVQVHGTALIAEDVPGRGAFQQGRTHWRFSRGADRTRLEYEASFIPAFTVPPLIGRTVVARFVERVTLGAMAELERRALAGND
jgi:hypothetical protein